MMRIEGVKAVFDGAWWVVEVPGHGATQCRRVSDVERMARALVADLHDIDPSEVEVEVEVKVPHVSEQLRRARRAQEVAEEAIRAQAAARRALVRELQAQGLSQHDIAAVVGVSRPMVQKLLREKTAA